MLLAIVSMGCAIGTEHAYGLNWNYGNQHHDANTYCVNNIDNTPIATAQRGPIIANKHSQSKPVARFIEDLQH